MITADLPTLRSLTDALAEQGEQPAILALHKEGLTRWTFEELAERIRQLAGGLLDAGLERGDKVALLAANRPEWIAACLAAIRAGAVAVPVDVQLEAQIVAHVLNDSGAKFVFTIADQLERLEKLTLENKPRPLLFDAAADDARGWQQLHQSGSGNLPALEAEDTATLFYTSGTTGRPKGVPLSHANLVFQLKTVLETGIITAADRALLPLPLHHVYPFVFGMLTPLAAALPIIMPHSLTGPQVIRAIREGEATVVIGVPRLYRALFAGIQGEIASAGKIATALFKLFFGASRLLRRYLGLRWGRRLLGPVHQQFGPTLRLLASGGSKLEADLAWTLESLGWQVGTGYGLTETAPLLTINLPEQARFGSAGRPLAGVEIQIDPSARPDHEEQAPTGSSDESDEPGEVLAKGPNLFAGYHNLPEQTQESFTEEGWFRTGDLGYFDRDGYLHITGRISTLIVTESGENIQPDEIEAVFEQEAVIREVGVLPQDNQLVAVIVPELNEIAQLEEDEIDTAIRRAVERRSEKLASYQRLADYALSREALPRTRLGKIRRHLLPDRYEQAKKEQGKEDGAAPGPISLKEMSGQDQALLEDSTARQVWEWLAERYPDRRLSPDTNPQLDLGVDSLEWLNITLEIRQRVGVELDETAIERVNTVRDLLNEVVDAARSGDDGSAGRALEAPEEILSERQQRWLQPYGPVRSVVSRGMYGLNRLLVRTLFRFETEGLENLADLDHFVLAPNHVSYLDPPVLAAALDHRYLRRTYWAGARNVVFYNPLLLLVSRLSRTVPVESEGGAAASLAFGAAVLRQKKNMVWFPEGRRSMSGELLLFRPGLGIVLDHFQAPVVPVYIDGTYRAMPPGQALPRFLKPLKVKFGRPQHPARLDEAGEGDQPYERIVQALHRRVAELSEESSDE